jgi:hypothetical protein
MSLLSLLIKPADDNEPSPETGHVPAPVTQAAQAAQVPAAASQPIPTDAASEAKILEKLNDAFEKDKPGGIDFLTFFKAIHAMNMIPDEKVRYQAAFGSLAAQGAQADVILSTADHYLQILADKQRDFEGFLVQQREVRVQSKTAEAEGIRKAIQDKSEQIAKLTQEITQLSTDELNARNEASRSEADLAAYQNTFESVKARVQDEILAIKQKISDHVIASTPR